MRRTCVAVVGLMAVAVGTGAAQETGTPVFHGPYRSFAGYEFGGTVSFQPAQQTAIEGQYRRAFGQLDAGLRAGAMIRDDVQDSFLVGFEARHPLISELHFPLRGALVTGVGLDVSGGVSFWLPVGLTLGRRLTVENSAVSFVPYVQPTGFITSTTSSKLAAALGAGLDIRMSAAFEVRVAGSFGSSGAPEGISVAASWLR